MSGLVLDLFAGPGGWDEGVRPLGLRPVGVEWDDAACRTGKAAGHRRVRADVAALPTEPMVGKVRGLIASPPCQTFSMAGKGKGRDALPELQDAVEGVWRGLEPVDVCPDDLDVRSVLVLEPVRYARDLRPEWIACEQVPAVLPIWQAFAVVLRAHGYSAWCGVLNAADYGVPQTRQRAILIASRTRRVSPPAPTHARGGGDVDLFGDQLTPWVSMATALGWGIASKPAGTLVAGDASKRGRNPLDGGSRAREVYDGAQRSGDWVQRANNGGPGQGGYHRRTASAPSQTINTVGRSWAWDRPATTVVGSFSPDIIAAPGYRLETSRQNAEGSVRVTVQEAAMLQSFPPDYPWQGSRTKQFEQVGNAVPPRLALHVIAAVTGLALPLAVAA